MIFKNHDTKDSLSNLSSSLSEVEFPLNEKLTGKNIQKIMYFPNSNKVFIWCNNKPIVVDVDLKSMTKTAENYERVFNGKTDSKTKENVLLIISDGLAPYMLEFVKNGGVYGYGMANGNSNTDGLTDEYATALNNANRAIPKFPEDELAEIPNRDYSGFVINTIKKEVKRDDVLIRQVFYTATSAYTLDPINLGIISPTSEGKTYVTMKVMKYFPKEDVWNIGAMSTKALVRQKGIIINSKGESIQEKVDKLRNELRDTTVATIRIEQLDPVPKVDDADKKKQPSLSDRVNAKKAEIKKELDSLLDDACKLIDLKGKILIFLEPPQHELWTLLKPILSHDEVEITYPYVDRTDEREGLRTQNVVVRGWPSCIFCSAKDESEWKIWPEIQSRFLITSPNMNKEKVQDGNMLIAQRKGLPNSIQQHVIVSDKDRQLAKECVSYLKKWINRLFQVNLIDYEHSNSVWVPYYEILASALKSDRGTDNRATNRIFSLLNIIPLTKVHLRPTLVYGKERLVIATLDDLGETLHITQNMSGIPTHKIHFYRDIFTELYQSKIEPDTKNDKVEDRIGVTTSQLAHYYNLNTGKVISSDSVRKLYLDELLNNGFIDQQDSTIDKRQKIYFPLMHIPKDEKIKNCVIGTDSRNLLQHNRIILPKNFNEIPEDWLKLEILTLLKYGNSQGTFQLIDKNDDGTCICQFVRNYEKDASLIPFFVKPKYSNYHSQIFGEMKCLCNEGSNDEKNYGNESESCNSLFLGDTKTY